MLMYASISFALLLLIAMSLSLIVDILNLSNIALNIVVSWQKAALLQAWVVGWLVRLANVPFAGCQRILKYFERGQKN